MTYTKRNLSFAGIWALAIALFMPLQAKAIVLLPPCTKTGDCGISDILIVLVNGAEFLLGISGAVALLFFIYGGFTMLTSAGKPEQVEKGKTILRNAVIGVAIIFTSGIIVRFTTEALTGRLGSRIHVAGESCNPASQDFLWNSRDKCTKDSECKAPGHKCVIPKDRKTGTCLVSPSGLFITIPSGVNPDKKTEIVPEELKCVAKEPSATLGAPCAPLNTILEARSRKEKYQCLDVGGDPEGTGGIGTYEVRSCVRGLCSGQGASIACCIAVDPQDPTKLKSVGPKKK